MTTTVCILALDSCSHKFRFKDHFLSVKLSDQNQLDEYDKGKSNMSLQMARIGEN